MSGLTAFAVLLVGLLVFACFQSCKNDRENATIYGGTVIGKRFEPAWTQFVHTQVGNTTTLIPIHHPEQWLLIVLGTNTDGLVKHVPVRVDPLHYREQKLGEYITIEP